MGSSKGISAAAMICGIVGIVGSFFSAHGMAIVIISLICGIAGIVLGAMGMKKANAAGESKGMAVAGLVCGIIGTVFAVGGLICWISCYAAANAIDKGLNDAFNSLSASLN